MTKLYNILNFHFYNQDWKNFKYKAYDEDILKIISKL